MDGCGRVMAVAPGLSRFRQVSDQCQAWSRYQEEGSPQAQSAPFGHASVWNDGHRELRNMDGRIAAEDFAQIPDQDRFRLMFVGKAQQTTTPRARSRM
jgi:hypothetical protein